MVHLNVHSCYSFLSSTIRIDSYLERLVKKHEDIAVLTDLNNMCGAMEFVKKCDKKNIKPILGMEVSIFKYDVEYKVILIALNTNGYYNLLKITPLLNKDLTMEKLFEYQGDIAFIIPSTRSYFGNAIHKDELEVAVKEIEYLKENIKNLYIGLEAYNKIDLEDIKTIRSLKTGVTLLALNEVNSLEKDNEALAVLEAIKDNKLVSEVKTDFSQRYLKSEAEMAKLFLQEEIDNTHKVASLVTKYEFSSSIKMIKYCENSKEFLASLALKGLKKRLNGKLSKKYTERLDYELSIIDKMGYNDYFLVVYDYVKFAKTNDIIVGPGRGSAGGSLVAYVLGITDIDPIKYDLYFERFLNPGRTSMPDIDIDFEDRRRDEVIEYLKTRWGVNHVASIATFQTMGIKQAIRDVCRVLGTSSSTMNVFSKKIPTLRDISTENIFEYSPEFKEFISSNEQYQKIFDLARKLEGLPRQMSLHAAGMIISDKPLENYVPVVVNETGYICQFEHDYLEELGLFKMDLLGLKNITIINDCLHIIHKTNPDFKLHDIDLSDERLYLGMNNNLLSGIFQLESSGMRKALLTIKPTCFDDVCATIALFRPGPRDFIPTYGERKNNNEPIKYPDSCLEEILRSTQGIIIYQEQVLEICRKMALFSYGEADIFRRIISKKDPSKLEEVKKDFIAGGLKNGKSVDLLNKVFNMLAKFAGYGFNKAHTVAYSYIAIWMMYFKLYYPSVFFSCLMNNFAGVSMNDKFFEYLVEAKKLGVKVISPSVNAKEAGFYNEDKYIRFALNQIKGVNANIVNEIIKENVNPFKDYIDFVVRMKPRGLTEKHLEALIYAGALDEFGLNRASMFASIEIVMSYASRIVIINKDQYLIDYDLASKPLLKIVNEQNDLEKEKEVTGSYLSGFPLEKDRESLTKNGYSLVANLEDRKTSKIAVMIRHIKTMKDRKGNVMALIKASDESGDIDLTLFASAYENLIKEIEVGSYAYIVGKVEVRERVTMIIDNAKKIRRK